VECGQKEWTRSSTADVKEKEKRRDDDFQVVQEREDGRREEEVKKNPMVQPGYHKEPR
jgi:hypothetical protein